MRKIPHLIGVYVVGCLAGCNTEIPQEVSVKFVEEPEASEIVALFESLECSGNYLPARVVSNGEYVFITKSVRGGIGVVTQELALCVQRGSQWNLIWSGLHGGGAKRIEILCESFSVGNCQDEIEY